MPPASHSSSSPRRTAIAGTRVRRARGAWPWAAASVVALAALVGVTVASSTPKQPHYDALIVDGASATSPAPKAPDDAYARSDAVAGALAALAAEEFEVVDTLNLSGDRVLIIVRR